jgi:uncharacterized protein DUF2510
VTSDGIESYESAALAKSTVAGLARPLRNAARALEGVAVLGAIAGVVLGIIFAATETTMLTAGFGGVEATTEHPYVAAGIAIALESLIAGWFFWAMARGLQLLAVDTADRHGINLDEPSEGAAAVPAITTATRDTPAGWYPDQLIANPEEQWRYWNGSQWTAETRKEAPSQTDEPPR